jgi:hypothetical protein
MKKKWKPPSKKEKRGENSIGLSPRNMKAYHSNRTALLQSVAEIGSQSTMKSSRKTLHELTSHIPPKPSKGNIIRSTNEMLHADVTNERESTAPMPWKRRTATKIAKRYVNDLRVGGTTQTIRV